MLLSILSEKETWNTGFVLIPYKVWLEVNDAASMVFFITSKPEGAGGGVGGGADVEDFLH